MKEHIESLQSEISFLREGISNLLKTRAAETQTSLKTAKDDKKLPHIYTMNETDIKQTQIHDTKKDGKVTKLKVNRSRSKDEAKENKETDKNIKRQLQIMTIKAFQEKF